MRILVAEDDYISRIKLKTLLGNYGDCDAVPNGQIAYEMFLVAHQDGAPYDLVTLDINMPKMDGHSVLKLIRKYEDLNDIFKTEIEAKILMITAVDTNENILGSFKEGCEDYLVKPVTTQKIVAVLQNLSLVD